MKKQKSKEDRYIKILLPTFIGFGFCFWKLFEVKITGFFDDFIDIFARAYPYSRDKQE